ncbi:hypothetical protein PF010_g3636 [Phytophthora fragariae]|uniref:Uncharacterized protein n=1 Tax=Phytophthora fragariae TaxID=53985 RepID=A0A6A3QR87_9STRA|nr:hypothetical protein PF011_g26472 [Phytophthora fragariae]KAE9080980.1 hypothetical protein PF006_g27210 [Phytophthora fragariae]KAE9131061.1 hypothetical protein PF010_g3636 [Phytophthora fragariae]
MRLSSWRFVVDRADRPLAQVRSSSSKKKDERWCADRARRHDQGQELRAEKLIEVQEPLVQGKTIKTIKLPLVQGKIIKLPPVLGEEAKLLLVLSDETKLLLVLSATIELLLMLGETIELPPALSEEAKLPPVLGEEIKLLLVQSEEIIVKS